MGEFFRDKGEIMLKKSRQFQNQSRYKEAIQIYDRILSNSNLPLYIKDEARVCRMLAKRNLPVLKNYSFLPEYIRIAEDGKKYYKDNKCSYVLYGDYNSFKKYFDRQQDWVYIQSPSFKLDKNGVPMVKYDGKFYYNAVTICQYALYMYDKYMEGCDTRNSFLNIADFLTRNIKEDGSLRYEFKYNHYECLKEGWTSSMSQGQALSVFARAYYLTEDPKYIESGQKALKYLLMPISKGGVMDNLGALDKKFESKIFFQQYINSTSTYTLNGHIFTLIGLYDWSNVRCAKNIYYFNLARRYWNKGLDSLKCILPYYDLGNFTAYDLHHIVKKSVPSSSDFYHSVHIEQMNVLYVITGEEYFRDMRDLWISYIK